MLKTADLLPPLSCYTHAQQVGPHPFHHTAARSMRPTPPETLTRIFVGSPPWQVPSSTCASAPPASCEEPLALPPGTRVLPPIPCMPCCCSCCCCCTLRAACTRAATSAAVSGPTEPSTSRCTAASTLGSSPPEPAAARPSGPLPVGSIAPDEGTAPRTGAAVEADWPGGQDGSVPGRRGSAECTREVVGAKREGAGGSCRAAGVQWSNCHPRVLLDRAHSVVEGRRQW